MWLFVGCMFVCVGMCVRCVVVMWWYDCVARGCVRVFCLFGYGVVCCITHVFGLMLFVFFPVSLRYACLFDVWSCCCVYVCAIVSCDCVLLCMCVVDEFVGGVLLCGVVVFAACCIVVVVLCCCCGVCVCVVCMACDVQMLCRCVV